MDRTDNQKRFTQYYQLSNRIIEVAEKDTLADVVRLLAIQLAHYQNRYGKTPMDETLRFLHSDALTYEDLGLAADGMELLVGLLGVASGLVGDESAK